MKELGGDWDYKILSQALSSTGGLDFSNFPTVEEEVCVVSSLLSSTFYHNIHPT